MQKTFSSCLTSPTLRIYFIISSHNRIFMFASFLHRGYIFINYPKPGIAGGDCDYEKVNYFVSFVREFCISAHSGPIKCVAWNYPDEKRLFSTLKGFFLLFHKLVTIFHNYLTQSCVGCCHSFSLLIVDGRSERADGLTSCGGDVGLVWHQVFSMHNPTNRKDNIGAKRCESDERGKRGKCERKSKRRAL